MNLFKGYYEQQLRHLHCVKRVRMQSYSGPYFPAFQSGGNNDQNNSEY